MTLTHMMKNNKISILLFCSLCFGTAWFWFRERELAPTFEVPETIGVASSETANPEDTVEEAVVTEVKPSLPKRVSITSVPFTVQAPDAQWSNPIFQDACEEASLVMANAWVQAIGLTKETSKQGIEALASYQKKLYGHSVDTSIDDTATLLQDFFSVTTGEVRRGVTVLDIKEALAAHKIVIVPTDGRKLKNPNFKQPGPARHMLVLIGYDEVTEEFVTNDPGTRKGEGYRYDQTLLYNAILDYVTGQHALVTSSDKVMLTVSRVKPDALQK